MTDPPATHCRHWLRGVSPCCSCDTPVGGDEVCWDAMLMRKLNSTPRTTRKLERKDRT